MILENHPWLEYVLLTILETNMVLYVVFICFFGVLVIASMWMRTKNRIPTGYKILFGIFLCIILNAWQLATSLSWWVTVLAAPSLLVSIIAFVWQIRNIYIRKKYRIPL
jgi:hypothetical protein